MKKLIRIPIIGVLLFCFIIFNIKANTDSLIDDSVSIDTSNIDTSNIDMVKSENKTLVYKFDIKEQIGPPVWRITKLCINEAISLNADFILIHMNTYGGLVDAADSIRTKILNCKIPIIVYIDNNAASAGALISIACDEIYMRKGGSIGAATVVNQTGEEMPDKYQSFMRSTMRATAEAHGCDTIINNLDNTKEIKCYRDPKIAEAMVDERVSIPGIIDSGKVLTFTSHEALKYGYCEGIAENYEEVLNLAGVENYELKEYKKSMLDKMIGLLISPVISGLLIMVILGGIYFEMQTPGLGFPIAASVLAAVLYFAPLYLEGLVENWELILFLVGLILIGLEIFVIPGFGFAGILGVLFAAVGLALSMVDKIVWDFESGNIDDLLKAFVTVVFSFTCSFFISIYFSKKLSASPMINGLSLAATQDKEDGYIAVETRQLGFAGKEGIAATVLRPSGKIEIDGEYYDATSEIGFVEQGTKIKVTRYETGQLYVVKC